MTFSDTLFTVRQASKLTNLSEATIRNMIAKKQIIPQRSGKRLYFTVTELERVCGTSNG